MKIMTTKEWQQALEVMNQFNSFSYIMAGIDLEHFFGKGNEYSSQFFKLHDDLVQMKNELLEQMEKECPEAYQIWACDVGNDKNDEEN